MKNVALPISISISAIALFILPTRAASYPLATEISAPVAPLLIAQNPVLVLHFRTERYTVRVLEQGDEFIMNVLDRQNGGPRFSNVRVVKTANPEGDTYINSEVPVRVFLSRTGNEAFLTIDDMTESATEIIVPDSGLNSIKEAECRAFSNIAFIYQSEGQMLMDVTDRDLDATLLQGVPVTATSSDEGTDYAYTGELTVDVFTSDFDSSCAIRINDELEYGTQ